MLICVFTRIWEVGRAAVISGLRKQEILRGSETCSRSYKTVMLRPGTGPQLASRSLDFLAHATCLGTSDLPRLPSTVPGPGRRPAMSGPCVLTCPPHPQVRGHLPGGEGAEPAGVPAQRAYLLPSVPGHPARGAAPGLVQRGLHEALAQHVPGDHPPQSG